MTGTNYKCHICGKHFKALYAYLFHLKQEHEININEYILENKEYDFSEAKCPICGNLRSMSRTTGRFTATTCGGHDCHQALTIRTNTERYGCSSFTSSEEFKLKAATTKMKKYGHPNFRNPDKCKKNSIDKYGVTKERYRVAWNMIEGWNQYVIPTFNKVEYAGLLNKYTWKCQLCGREFESTIHTTRHVDGHQFDRMPRCFHCFPRIRGTSIEEKELIQFCKQFFPNLKSNDKSLIGKELDIVIPELNLAIEYNGLYWHSSLNPKFVFGCHIEKTNKCESVGYRLIHIWEDDWLTNNDKIREDLTKIFNKTELIPNLIKYNRFWYSPLQFPNTQVNIVDSTIEHRNYNNKTFVTDNCGYFTIPPLLS